MVGLLIAIYGLIGIAFGLFLGLAACHYYPGDDALSFASFVFGLVLWPLCLCALLGMYVTRAIRELVLNTLRGLHETIEKKERDRQGTKDS